MESYVWRKQCSLVLEIRNYCIFVIFPKLEALKKKSSDDTFRE